MELVRLAAAILGVSFDSLMQRARRRRARIIASATALAFAIVTGIAAFTLWSNAQIRQNYEQAIINHAQTLASEAERELQSGDRLAAIELASAAVPSKDENREVLPRVEHTLCTATCAYRLNDDLAYTDSAQLVAKFPLTARAASMSTSPDGAYIGAIDDAGTVRVWDCQTAELLFQTQVDASHHSEVVVTDEGFAAIGDKASVSCWDIHTQESLWARDVEEQTSGHMKRAYHLLLDAAKGSLVCVGLKTVCRIDISTGDMTGEVAYALREDEFPSGVKGAVLETDAFVHPTGLCAVTLTRSYEGNSADSYDQICVVDFEKNVSTLLPSRYGMVHSALFAQDNSLLVSFSDEGKTTHDESSLHRNGFAAQKKYARHVERVSLDRAESAWRSDEVALWMPPVNDFMLPLPALDEPAVTGDQPRDALSYCVGNVCALLEASTGRTLARFEAFSPFVVAWAHTKDGKTDGLRGYLADGRSSAVFFSTGICSSYAPSCISSSQGMRLGSRTVLASQDGVLYSYRDDLEDKSFTRVLDTSTPYCIGTAHGAVVVDSITQDQDGASTRGLKISMLDGTNKCASWEKTLYANGSSPSVIGYDDEERKMYVRMETDGERCMVASIDLANGETQEWPAVANTSQWDDTLPYVPGRGSCAGSFVADVRQGGGELELLLTDLASGTSTTRSLAPLGAKAEAVMPYGDARCSPRGDVVLVELLGAGHDFGLGIHRRALWRLGDDAYAELPVAINVSSSPMAWSHDGERFAAFGEGRLVVCGADGTVLLDVPMEGKEVLGIHLDGDRVLAVCDEEEHTALVSYGLAGDGAMRRAIVDDEPSDASSGGEPLNRVQWADVPSRRGSTPGSRDLCVALPHERRLYVVDGDTLEVRQRVSGAMGYDARSDCFVVRGYADATAPVGLFDHYTVNKLVELGLTQVGNSHMTEAQRSRYGLG